MFERYSTEEESLIKKLEEYEAKLTATRDSEADISKWMDSIRQVVGIEELDRSLLLPLVDRIVVHNHEVIEHSKQNNVKHTAIQGKPLLLNKNNREVVAGGGFEPPTFGL